MANIEIRSVEGLAGTAVPYAYAVKAGPWLFLTGHEAFDFATGGAPEVEGPRAFLRSARRVSSAKRNTS